MSSSGTSRTAAKYLLLGLGMSAVLIWLRVAYGYLVFHTIVEVFSLVVAVAIFTVTWNTRHISPNGYLDVLGVSFLWVGIIDTLHLLTYKGIELLPVEGANIATQLWVAGRFVLALAVLAAPFAIGRRPRGWTLMLVWGTLSIGLLTAIAAGVFPQAYIEGAGLTRFKLASEVAIVAAFAGGWMLLARRRTIFDRDVFLLLTGFVASSVAAELAFMLYADPYAVPNLVGHLLRTVAYVFVYRAIVTATLRRPYDTLFRELQTTADALAHSEELYRVTVEQASEGIVHLGRDGSILMANARAAEIMGRDADELVGITISAITRVDEPTELMTSLARLADGDVRSCRVEAQVVGDGRHAAWISVGLSAVRDESNEPGYFIGVVEDITEQLQAAETLRRSRDLSEAIAAIDMAVNATDSVDEIVTVATDAAGRAFGCDLAVTLTREETAWLVRAAYPASFETLLGRPFPLKALLQAAEAIRTGEPFAVDDVAASDFVDKRLAEEFGLRSTMAVPLLHRHEAIGVLYLAYREHTHHFTEPETDFGGRLASSLALAIENARLNSAQRRVADALQSALLVAPESLPGIDIGFAYESQAELARVGGDFLDVFPLGASSVAFVVGDVAGKGLEAATFTAEARTTIRAFASQAGRPGEALVLANRVLVPQLDEGRFVTVVLGTLDVCTGDVALACAGHPEPAFVTRGDYQFREIDRSPPLGVVEDTAFTEYRTTLEPGDRVVLFSDGLLDARQGLRLFGEDGVLSVLRISDEQSPAGVARMLLDAAREFSGGSLKDDIAIVVLEYAGPPSTTMT